MLTTTEFTDHFSKFFDESEEYPDVGAAYDSLNMERRTDVARRLNVFAKFREEFLKEPPGCDAEVSVRFFSREDGPGLWLCAHADPDGESPFVVDEAVKRAADATGLGEEFSLAGTGGGVGSWHRDNDFWENRATQ